MRTACWSWLFVAAATIAGAAEPPTPKSEAPNLELPRFELFDGDRVVFLGNTLIEREQKYGYWELMLTMAWPERNVTFRNLGWSGDTVWGESRAGFGTQADGFKALVNQVNAAKPTVIFIGYGNVEAFDGEAGLPKFIDGYNKLLDELEKTKARIIVLGPTVQIEQLSPSPTCAKYNVDVERYSTTMREIAKRRKHVFIDLTSASKSFNAVDRPYTNADNLSVDGMSWGPLAYLALGLQLNGEFDKRFMRVDHGFAKPQSNVDVAKENDNLMQQIIKKNELFFHRWRPQNETYLFGFRKHEQGKNAEEVFAFDPLIEAEEKKIAELRVRLAAEMKKASDADAK